MDFRQSSHLLIMKKLKVAPFIIVGTLVHLGLGFAVFSKRANCNFQAECLSTAMKVCEQILALPLNLLVEFFHLGGGEQIELLFIYPALNSFLVVTIIWALLVRPFVQRARKRANTNELGT